MVVRKGDPRVLRLVVKVLHALAGAMTQEEFGRRSRVSQSDISRWEAGLDAPSEDALRRMAQTAGAAWPLEEHLIHFFTVVRSAVDREALLAAEPAAAQLESAVLDAVLLAVAPYLLEGDAGLQEPSAEQERQEAEEVWAALDAFPPPRRRELIELGPPSARTSALVAVVREASERAVADDPAEAQELADFAGVIAGRRGERSPPC